MQEKDPREIRARANRAQQAIGAGLSISLFFAEAQPWPGPQATLKPYITGLIGTGFVFWTVNRAMQVDNEFREYFDGWRRFNVVWFNLIQDYLTFIVATLIAFAIWNIPAWLRTTGLPALLASGGLKDTGPILLLASSILMLVGMGVFLFVFLMAIRSGEKIEFQTQWGGLGGGGGGWRISTPAVSIIVFLMLTLALGLSQLQVKVPLTEAQPPVSTTGGEEKQESPAPEKKQEAAPATPANQAQSPPKSNPSGPAASGAEKKE